MILEPPHGDEADVLREVELREVLQVFGSEVLLGPQEAEPNGVEPEGVEMRLQPVLVVGPDGADVDRTAVAQERVGGVALELAHHGRDARDPVQPCRMVM